MSMELVKRSRVIAALMGLIVFLPGFAQTDSPNDFVAEAVDLLATQLDGRRESLAEDKDSLYAVIDEILLPRFDRRFAASQVLARHWRSASEDQRDRFVDAFYTTLLHRYAEGVLEFDHEGVEILPFRGDASKRLVGVKTIVRLDDGTKVPVNYTLVSQDVGWRMFDVTIEGVSYVRNFRAEFDSEIRATSLEQVIERLEKEATDSGE
jgi:phospholipid transport system substrate-binding protein